MVALDRGATVQVVQLLVAMHADPTAKDQVPYITELMLLRHPFRCLHELAYTPLFLFCFAQFERPALKYALEKRATKEVVEFLINNGADPESADEVKQSRSNLVQLFESLTATYCPRRVGKCDGTYVRLDQGTRQGGD